MPIPAGFGQVSYVFEGPGAGPGGCMVTLGVDHAFDQPPTSLAEDLFDAFATAIVPGLTTDVTLVEARLRIGTTEGEIVASFFGSEQGADSGDSLPSNCCYPVTKFTALGGRKNRGRWFLPGVDEAHVDAAGAIDSGVITGFNTSLGAFLIALDGLGFEPVILHSQVGEAPTPIIAFIMGQKIFTRGTRLRS